jgi:hypothetical protein
VPPQPSSMFAEAEVPMIWLLQIFEMIHIPLSSLQTSREGQLAGVSGDRPALISWLSQLSGSEQY